MDNKKVKTDQNKAEKEVVPVEIEKLKQEIEKLKLESLDNKNKYLRALADYQNLEKRSGDERIELFKIANQSLLIKILPFLDNLEKAEVFIKDQGLKISKDHFMQILKEAGLEEIELLGKEYDPNFAEAVDIVPGKEDNKVVEVLRKGYKFGDKLIRVAQVKVSKKL